MLVLPIKKKWFDMIKSGEKKEEYRELKRYYDNRLPKYFGTFIANANGTSYGWNENNQREIVFRNGYGFRVPQIKCLCTLSIGTGNPKWRSRKRQNVLCFKNITNFRR